MSWIWGFGCHRDIVGHDPLQSDLQPLKIQAAWQRLPNPLNPSAAMWGLCSGLPMSLSNGCGEVASPRCDRQHAAQQGNCTISQPPNWIHTTSIKNAFQNLLGTMTAAAKGTVGLQAASVECWSMCMVKAAQWLWFIHVSTMPAAWSRVTRQMFEILPDPILMGSQIQVEGALSFTPHRFEMRDSRTSKLISPVWGK